VWRVVVKKNKRKDFHQKICCQNSGLHLLTSSADESDNTRTQKTLTALYIFVHQHSWISK